MEFTLEFVRIFAYTTYLIAPILASLSILIITLGQIVTNIEGWSRSDGLYWTFITATTVGYGDIRPVRNSARLIAIFIAILGVIFTGILVSIAIESTSHTFKMFADPTALETIKEHLSSKVIL